MTYDVYLIGDVSRYSKINYIIMVKLAFKSISQGKVICFYAPRKHALSTELN